MYKAYDCDGINHLLKKLLNNNPKEFCPAPHSTRVRIRIRGLVCQRAERESSCHDITWIYIDLCCHSTASLTLTTSHPHLTPSPSHPHTLTSPSHPHLTLKLASPSPSHPHLTLTLASPSHPHLTLKPSPHPALDPRMAKALNRRGREGKTWFQQQWIWIVQSLKHGT